MATSTHISIAEYLSTVYRPDREYIDGELIKKNMGPAWTETTRLEIPGTPIYADVTSLFAALDRQI